MEGSGRGASVPGGVDGHDAAAAGQDAGEDPPPAGVGLDPPPESTLCDVTRLLRSVAEGERDAESSLYLLVGLELRRLAEWRLMRLRPGDSIRTTELVDDAFLRLVRRSGRGFEGRRHFYNAAACAMDNLIRDRLRKRVAEKRKHGGRRVSLNELRIDVPGIGPDEYMTLAAALDELRADNRRAHEVVMLRTFGGLSTPEVARLFSESASGSVSVRTIERLWAYGRARLRELFPDDG